MITSSCPLESVAGEIRELTNQWNLGNKIQEIHEHICEIAEIFFRLFIDKKMTNNRNSHNWEISEITFSWYSAYYKPFVIKMSKEKWIPTF